LENGDIERSPIVAKVLNIWTGQSCSQGAPHCDLEVEMSSQDSDPLDPKETKETKDREELKGLRSEEETKWCDKPRARIAPQDRDAALIPIQHMPKNRDLSL
jgi:hypothetical protein